MDAFTVHFRIVSPVTKWAALAVEVDTTLLQDCAVTAIVTAFYATVILAVCLANTATLFKAGFALLRLVQFKYLARLLPVLQDVLSAPTLISQSIAFMPRRHITSTQQELFSDVMRVVLLVQAQILGYAQVALVSVC
jgi:hypothetical protein